ncbi:MAG TPA: amidase [Vicinamibacterales bacterium]|nr:amidase [Vicinamibacterales bacterium]
MADDLHFLTVQELSRLIATKKLSPVELTRVYIERAETLDRPPFPLPNEPQQNHGSKLASIITLVRDQALEQARIAEREIGSGKIRGPLHGIPYGVKDLLDSKGVRTTWGSRIFADRIPDADSAVVEKLNAAGGILMAKMAMAEFAGGNTSSALNPWKLDRSSMGSSSGTVVGAVAGLIAYGIGSETGGSIVLPAATVGASGLRPTFGRVSRFRCMPLSWCLDKLGPVARSAVDCGLILEAIAGHDLRDPSTADRVFKFRPDPGKIAGRKIAIHRTEFDAVQLPHNRAVFDAALDVFKRMGAVFEDVTFPDRPYGAVFANITNVEGGAIFRDLFEDKRIDGMFRYNWSRRADWLAGTMAPASDYLKAQRIRQMVVTETDALMSKYTAIVAPTSATGAPPREAPVQPPIPPPPRQPAGRTIPRVNNIANLSGLPGINIPVGFDAEDMPLCVQIVGNAWDEQSVLDLAMAFQKETDWHKRRPPFPYRA